MRCSRRQVVQGMGAMGLALLAACGRLPLHGQAQPSLYRIGFVGLSPAQPRIEPFRQGLREHGYIEGDNVVIDDRWADTNDQLRAIAAELAASSVDIIVAAGGFATGLAWQASSTIPIIGVNIAVGSVFAPSLARPGGNVTGLTAISAGLSAKRLELLRDTVPTARRVAILWSGDRTSPCGPGNPVRSWDETEAAGQVLGLQLQSVEVRSPGATLGGLMRGAVRDGAQALCVLDDAALDAHRAQIIAFAAENRMPVMYDKGDFVAMGGLMAYGPSFPALYQRAAFYVHRILKGTKPADLPIEQPTRFEFVINAKTAQALGLTIPPHVLLQATEVLQ